MSGAGSDPPYWSQDAAALAAALGSGPGGLSSEQAAARLAAVGANTVEDPSRLSAPRLLLRQFESPLVLILAFAATISLVLQQWVDAAIILAIVLGSALGHPASSTVPEPSPGPSVVAVDDGVLTAGIGVPGRAGAQEPP